MPQLKFFPEPPLLFNCEQSMLDPRDGLTLFGPLENAKPEGIRWGVIGTKDSGSSAESVGQMEAPGWADQLIPS